MVFVFVEDGTLEVVGSIEEAERGYEGIDVESEVFTFFDASGTYLKPTFTKPNRSGRFLGLFGWVESGEYRLAPSREDGEDIALFLCEAAELKPNPWFQSLAEVKDFLARGSGAGETRRAPE
jgi:hypothetical protein